MRCLIEITWRPGNAACAPIACGNAFAIEPWLKEPSRRLLLTQAHPLSDAQETGIGPGLGLANVDHRSAAWLHRKASAPRLAVRIALSGDGSPLRLISRPPGTVARAESAATNWFTEGFDTADLKDAKALLDELNS
jgi:hypothetical protein